MASNDSGGWSAQWAALIAILVATGGALFYVPALNSSRPDAEPGKRVASLGYEDREARLWQDPLRTGALGDDSASSDATQAQRFSADLHSQACTQPTTQSVMTSAAAQSPIRDDDDADVSDGPAHKLKDLCDQLADVSKGASVTVMPVMVEAGPYAELGEQRVRMRVAVLDALGAQKFSPEDAEHIGSVKVGWAWESLGDPKTACPKIAAALDSEPAGSSLVIPYEWCRQSRENAAKSGVDNRAILVLWLNENAFSDLPLTRLGVLCGKLRDKTGIALHFKIIGPRVSTILRAMAEEASRGLDTRTIHALSDSQMFSSTATAAEDLLLKDLPMPTDPGLDPPATVSELIDGQFYRPRDKRHFLWRLTLTDAELCRDVIGELERRDGIHIKSNVATEKSEKAFPSPMSDIAIVSEWDTFYARSLVQSFKDQASGIENGNPDWVHTSYYLRGIDGEVPAAERHKATDQQPKSADKNSKSIAYTEQPEGMSGLDYLRRIADEIGDLDQHLKANAGGRSGSGIRAVGVLGNDVYDKLLVMTALRDRLPNVQFFTIGMDARYALASEWSEAHNLILCSNFGLKLNEPFQSPMPPFRDGAQTAAFAAVRFAISEDSDRIRSALPEACRRDQPARLFIIGRNGPEDLSNGPVDRSAGPLHPPRERRFQWLIGRVGWFVMSAVTCGALLLVPVLLGIRPENIRLRLTLTYTVPFLILAVPLVLGAVFLLYFYDDPITGEPFQWVGGISIWPTELVRLLVIMLSIHFFFRIWRLIKENEMEIQKEFRLLPLPGSDADWKQEPEGVINALREPSFETAAANAAWYQRLARYWGMLGAVKHLRWLGLAGWSVYGPAANRNITLDWKNRQAASDVAGDTTDEAGEPTSKVFAQNLWWEYKHRSGVYRALRVVIMSAIYIAAAFLVLRILGFPHSPARGSYAQSWDFAIMTGTIISSIPLTFFVLDATYLNKRFIEHLIKKRTQWPHGVFDKSKYSETDLGVELTEYLDVQFIAMRTGAVGDIIYYPFLIFFLMIISRNAFFDNWDWPPGLIVILAGNIFLAIIGALMLRGAAEEARGCALEDLKQRHRKFVAAANEPKAKVIADLIQEVEDERRGAFSLLSQHPLLAAILLPSGSIGVWAVLDYFAKSMG